MREDPTLSVRNEGFPIRLSRQLPQLRLQDTPVPVLIHLDRSIHAADCAEGLGLAGFGVRGDDFQFLEGFERVAEVVDVEELVTGED